ncbi:hypothetical protein SAMN05421841_0937 [Chryseobacterium wanjuense]|jgi:hypothetical protein|uniref:Uncharacterized protein n=1 Tax=Chryseobacterium wanjuense TaxID=356305 RepID=A0A1I0P1X0_9FLAO|nr:hypothetical protein [Chryseobacterium wanjuense]SEW08050.1 hypothetical protein SAMN05421841_0937 [Chryseobacterium wanjuense]
MKKLLLIAMLVGTFGVSYAQSDYYNDYRRSITDVNWQNVIADLVLTTVQANQIYALNDRYRDYNSWNRIYVHNPDRWREDRYVELERILGRDKYVKFKTKYYKGQNPVAYYNRNKNNDKRYKHMDKKIKVHKQKHGNGHH